MKLKSQKSILVVLGILLVFSILVIGAEEEPVEFPNRDVEMAVKQQLGKATGNVYPSELKKMESFSPPLAVKTEDLSWIKYCKNLEHLDLTGSQIRDITPLANLTNLLALDLSRNDISDLSPLSDLHELEVVNLSDNDITDIKPLVENTGIKGNEKNGDVRKDRVVLTYNKLDLSEGSEDLQDIQTLLDRGVEVKYYPQKD